MGKIEFGLATSCDQHPLFPLSATDCARVRPAMTEDTVCSTRCGKKDSLTEPVLSLSVGGCLTGCATTSTCDSARSVKARFATLFKNCRILSGIRGRPMHAVPHSIPPVRSAPRTIIYFLRGGRPLRNGQRQDEGDPRRSPQSSRIVRMVGCVSSAGEMGSQVCGT